VCAKRCQTSTTGSARAPRGTRSALRPGLTKMFLFGPGGRGLSPLAPPCRASASFTAAPIAGLLWTPRCSEPAAAFTAPDGGDPVAFEGQHDQPGGARDRRVRVVAAAAERGLRVGARRHEPVAPTASPYGALRQEGRDRPRALVLERGGRHRDPRVVGEERDDAVDVVSFRGIDEPSHEPALGGRVCQWRALAVCRWEALLERSSTSTSHRRAEARTGRPSRCRGSATTANTSSSP
jgi:hypothetical protein